MRIEVCCELDADGVRESFNVIAGWLQLSSPELVLDLGRVTRMDSSGLGLLVGLQKRQLERGGRLAIANVRGEPLELLKRFRLLGVLGYIAPGTDRADVREPVAAPSAAHQLVA